VAKLMCPSPVARLLWERPSADAELNRDLVRLLKKPTKRPEG